MGDRVCDAVVESSTALHTNAQLLAHEHVASQGSPRMPRGLEPSYASTYKEVHKKEFQRLRDLVQTPQEGTFMHKDLTWATQIRAKGRRAGPRTQDPVSVAYIPWVRVPDFVKGEEARVDGPCKFVCQGTPSNLQGKLTFPRWNSYSTVMRCASNMYLEFHCPRSHVTCLNSPVPIYMCIALPSHVFDSMPDYQVSLSVRAN